MNPRTEKFQASRSSNKLNTLTSQMRRPNSATVDRISLRSLLPEQRRINSAKISKPEPPPLEPEPEEHFEEIDHIDEHKIGCPWRKARSQSKNRFNLHGSNPGLVHPKPWGARNPNDIPCFCRSKTGSQHVSRQASVSPTRFQDLKTRHEKIASKAKVSEVVTALCSVIEKKKMKVNDFELNLFFDILKEKLQKYKDTAKEKPQEPQAKPQTPANPRGEKSPVRRSRMAQSLTPSSPAGYQAVQPVSRENLADQHRNAPMGTPVLGKVESNKYFIELRGEEQVPPGLKQMLGMMNPHGQDKQFVLMDGSSNVYMPGEELRQYTVMNAGVQLSHHEQNTMVLLGNQRLPTPTRGKQQSLAVMPSQSTPSGKSKRP